MDNLGAFNAGDIVQTVSECFHFLRTAIERSDLLWSPPIVCLRKLGRVSRVSVVVNTVSIA